MWIYRLARNCRECATTNGGTKSKLGTRRICRLYGRQGTAANGASGVRSGSRIGSRNSTSPNSRTPVGSIYLSFCLQLNFYLGKKNSPVFLLISTVILCISIIILMLINANRVMFYSWLVNQIKKKRLFHLRYLALSVLGGS